jgi:predicted flap endonuclease-1-like 5' DNA nuclease
VAQQGLPLPPGGLSDRSVEPAPKARSRARVERVEAQAAQRASVKSAAPADSPAGAAWDGLAGLPGIGPKTADKLRAQGIHDCWDLVRWISVGLPRHQPPQRSDLVADGAPW